MSELSTSPDSTKAEKRELKERPASDKELGKLTVPTTPKPESPVLKQINDAIGTGNI